MLSQTPYNEVSPFIVTTPARQSVEEKRKLIRRHVMRGKNRKKLSSRPSQWIKGGSFIDIITLEKDPALSIPTKVGNELSFVPFSADMGPDMLEAIWKLNRAMLPLESCLTFNGTKSAWFSPVWNDEACLHFTIFTARIYLDAVHNRTDYNKNTLAHYVKALNVLQRRLACTEVAISTSDSTILVVVGLTMAATAHGDLETASKHVKGLHQMILLRGGLSAFKTNRPLQFKICRADLGVALGTGCNSMLFPDSLAWDTQSSQGNVSLETIQNLDRIDQMLSSELEQFLDGLDMQLRQVWNDLSEFVRLVNTAGQAKPKIDIQVYQELMISIHYRLINLHFSNDQIDESVRLALLIFASSLYLQWRDVKTRHEYLAQSFKSGLSPLRQNPMAIPALIILWLHLVGIVVVFEDNEQARFKPVLSDLLRVMKLKSWNEVRLLLGSILWVHEIHDPRGKEIVCAMLPEG